MHACGFTGATRGKRGEKHGLNVHTLSSPDFRNGGNTRVYHIGNDEDRLRPLVLHLSERACRCQFFPVHSSPLYT